jgi:hypothetical protein
MATILDEGLETRTVQQDIADALVLIERANAKLRPGELTRPEARSLAVGVDHPIPPSRTR